MHFVILNSLSQWMKHICFMLVLIYGHFGQVFRTLDKGWAVRSWDTIPSGAPVCEYTGIIRRTDDMENVSENNFIFEIDCLQTMKGLDGREVIYISALIMLCKTFNCFCILTFRLNSNWNEIPSISWQHQTIVGFPNRDA